MIVEQDHFSALDKIMNSRIIFARKQDHFSALDKIMNSRIIFASAFSGAFDCYRQLSTAIE